MTMMWIRSLVVVLGFFGSASIAWAAKPYEVYTEHREVHGATFETSFDAECVVSNFSIDALDSRRHISQGGGDFQEQHFATMHLLVWNQATGVLFLGNGIQDLSPLFGGDLNSATVSAEFDVGKYECSEDPTCSELWENCVFQGAETVDVDLTWTGIGEIHQTIENSTVHQGAVVDHVHLLRRERDAIVTGTVSDFDFDFEIEDIGELYEYKRNVSNDCCDD